LTGKVGHIDLVFGVQLGFISRSVQARLQVSVCSGAILVNLQTHTYRHTDRQHLDQLI